MQLQMGRRVKLHWIKSGGPKLLQLLKGLGEIVKKLFLILGVDIDILLETRILYQHNVAGEHHELAARVLELRVLVHDIGLPLEVHQQL